MNAHVMSVLIMRMENTIICITVTKLINLFVNIGVTYSTDLGNG